MDTKLQRHGSGYGNHGDQQLPRLRQGSSRGSHENQHQFGQSSGPTEREEVDSSGPTVHIRNTPFPMGTKRAVWRVQQKQDNKASSSKSWKQKNKKSLHNLRRITREAGYLFTLWGKTLQQIGGNFGGGVQSYFYFLRFLVVLNFVSFLLIAGFVLIPSIVFRSVGARVENSTGPEECMDYDPNPPGLVVFYNYFLDLLSGTGFMEYSYLFYGYYRNTQVVESSFSYNIPLAYLFTAVFYFAFCFFCLIIRMGMAARVVVATGGSAVGNYSRIIFTGWDYGCQGERAVRLKQKNIHYQLQVDLEEEAIRRRTASLTLCQRILHYTLRVVLFVAALGLNAAAFYGIFEATNFSQKNSGKEGILGLIFEYLPSIVITAGNFVVPLLCDQFALVERYSPSTTIILALFRAVFLRLLSLGVLLFTLWQQITCEGNRDSADCSKCHYNHREYPCWETRVGQEMYKLTLFDFLVNLAVLILVDFPRRMIVDHWPNKIAQWVGRQEFSVPQNVLGLVYGQTVVWTGALFCPLLPLINTIKFVILFYCKKITLFRNCSPALKTFRSTTSNFVFLATLVFGWGLATLVMIYSLAEIRPSMSCGPFRFFPTMWSIAPTSFEELSSNTQDFLFFIGSQAFSIPLFVFSCVVMCYFIALAAVYGKSVALLRAQLKLEGRDKQFLIKQIEELSRPLERMNVNSGAHY